MKARRIGLIMFWVGAALLFASSWLVPWWTSTVWQSKPIGEFAGTIWAFPGPISMAIIFSTILGIALAPIGSYLYGESGALRVRPFVLLVVGMVLVVLSYLLFGTMGYYGVLKKTHKSKRRGRMKDHGSNSFGYTGPEVPAAGSQDRSKSSGYEKRGRFGGSGGLPYL